MDIKLKNSRRLGIWIAVLTVLAATGAVMAFYPWLEKMFLSNSVKITTEMLESGAYSGYSVSLDGMNYNFYDTWRTRNAICWIMLGSFALTALAAFITGLIRPLGLTERKLFSLPAELLALTGFLALEFFLEEMVCHDFFPDMVQYTVLGQLGEELSEEFFLSPQAGDGLALGINALVWALCFAFIYWFVVTAESVFTLGLGRWFKERTLTGRLLLFGKRVLSGTCRAVEEVDFRDKSTRLLLKVVGVNFILLSVISCFWFFGIFGYLVYSVVLFFLMKKMYEKMQKKYQLLLDAAGKMAEGNLDAEITENLGIFEPLKEELGKVRQGFKLAVAEEVKSRSMKTELITNVSHDLKTPLTAIITYINLLKREDITPQERRDYVEILDQKSLRLKGLIEDLFEISKANSDNVTLNFQEVDIVSLMKQVKLELEDRIADSDIDFRWSLPEKRVILQLDSEKTYRIFENLLVNILKYAMPGTRAYVEIGEGEEAVTVSMKNISSVELVQTGDALTERFVRGDASRNTEGSGLGLAIAKSFTQLQKGTMEVDVEADLFKVRLEWKR